MRHVFSFSMQRYSIRSVPVTNCLLDGPASLKELDYQHNHRED